MKYKAIIFDLDGTLTDTLEDLANSVNTVLKEYGYPVHPIEKYRIMVGNGAKNLIKRAMPPDTIDSILDDALAKFKTVYAAHQLDNTMPYDGIIAMLNKLQQKHIPLAICTNKHDDAAKEIVKELFSDGLFTETIGDLPGTKRKPDPQKVLMIAENLAIEPQEIIYMGDSSVDMQTAVNAGMLPVGVLWGFRSKEELLENGAKVLLEQPEDLFSKVEFADN